MDNYANDTVKETTIENEKSAKKPRVIILLNSINEKGLLKDNHLVKIKNILGGTTEIILEEIEELVKNKSDTLIVHARTNDLTKGKNRLNTVKKVIKLVKSFSPQTKLVFSGLIVRKDKNNIGREVLDENARLRNFCNEKNIDYIDNNSIKEVHLGNKKLHLNKRGNSVFAQNLLRYLRSKYRENVNR